MNQSSQKDCRQESARFELRLGGREGMDEKRPDQFMVLTDSQFQVEAKPLPIWVFRDGMSLLMGFYASKTVH